MKALSAIIRSFCGLKAIGAFQSLLDVPLSHAVASSNSLPYHSDPPLDPVNSTISGFKEYYP